MLTGSTAGDRVGCWLANGSSCQYFGVTVLSNGNFVVTSLYWHNGASAGAGAAANAGAVTWGSSVTGVSGEVSAANSLVGATANDQVGYDGVTALNNGNYVVASPYWQNGTATHAGAVTWGNGATGVSGVVSAANSLVGSTANDHVGYFFIMALNNGNYVVVSPDWNNNAGAVTWGNGATGVKGVVSVDNSLVGSSASDHVGYYFISALNNGNYVVASP